MIALMYKAYSVSCNLKGTKAVISFIGALIIAEIISKIIFIFLLSSLFLNSPTTNIFNTKSSTENTVVIAETLSNREKTEKIIEAFEQGNAEAITALFDENMKKGLPAWQLKLVWIQTNMTCGKFEKADMTNYKETRIEKHAISPEGNDEEKTSSNESSINSHYVIDVPLIFKNNKRNLRLTFNSEGRISGMYLLPIN